MQMLVWDTDWQMNNMSQYTLLDTDTQYDRQLDFRSPAEETEILVMFI